MNVEAGSLNLVRDVRNALSQANSTSATAWDAALERVLEHFGCVTGTIHRLDAATNLLNLVAQRGIPETIIERVRVIPIGKGMAGLAAERREPVQVCNLQSDESGVAKPAAKLTGMEGSIAVPMLVEGRVCGVLGVAKRAAYEFSAEERSLLLEVAGMFGAAGQ